VGLALGLEDCHPSVLLHCWLGHLSCKIVSEMTYNVSSGTLNRTIQYMLPRYLMNYLNSFYKTDQEYFSLAPTDHLIRFWRSMA